VTRSYHVLGVDPGLTGAVALLLMRHEWTSPRLLFRCGATELDAVKIATRMADLIVIEQQQASPQMGRGGAFMLGLSVGMIEGVVMVMARCEPIRVMPSVWRPAFGIGGGAVGKEAGLVLAHQLLERPDERALIARHDEADAVLLAWWGWRHVLLPELETV